MVANRACAPASKLYCYEQWLKEDASIEGAHSLELHQLYRAMDFLATNKEAIEQAIYFQVADLLNLDVDGVFYDTTSLHFEIDEEDGGAGIDSDGAGADQAPGGPRRRGHSKNGRRDAPQVVVGLAVTRDGFPVRHWVFPGNTVDVSTVSRVKADLRGWKLGRCLFVGDAGMVSQANLQTLSRGGGKYLLAMPMRRGDEVTEAVLARPGRYHKVADNLEVKAVGVGDGERRRRYALCYKQQRVEEAWRSMKSGLNMRPVHHWAPHRIHAHIAITVLSLLLERAIEHAAEDTWHNIHDDLKQIQLAHVEPQRHRLAGHRAAAGSG
jgi:hypothetical protein